MYLEVYPDVIFVLNFFVDFFLIFLLKKMNRKKSNIGRMVLAAVIGALFAVITGIFPWMNIILRFIVMYMIATVLMILAAFGIMKLSDLIKQVVVLYIITYFIGGLLNSIYYHTNARMLLGKLGNGLIFSNISIKSLVIMLLIIIPIILGLLKLFRWYKEYTPVTYEVELIMDDQGVHTKGLLDTGNCLYDPLFKKPVIVVENSLMEKLLSTEFRTDLDHAKHFLENNELDTGRWNIGEECIHRLRFIPYQSIGKKKGMMLGLILDKVLIHTGKETICNEKVTAAICDSSLSTKDEYHVILHKELL